MKQEAHDHEVLLLNENGVGTADCDSDTIRRRLLFIVRTVNYTAIYSIISLPPKLLL